jgi:hypothetical protein
MKITPSTTGRLISGTTPYGDFAIEVHRDHEGPIFDADGKQIGTLRMVMKTPSLPVQKIEAGEQQPEVGCGTCAGGKSAKKPAVATDHASWERDVYRQEVEP